MIGRYCAVCHLRFDASPRHTFVQLALDVRRLHMVHTRQTHDIALFSASVREHRPLSPSANTYHVALCPFNGAHNQSFAPVHDFRSIIVCCGFGSCHTLPEASNGAFQCLCVFMLLFSAYTLHDRNRNVVVPILRYATLATRATQ